MAVDCHPLTPCTSGMESREGGDHAHRVESIEPPTTTGSEKAEVEMEAGPVVYKKGAWSKEEDEKLKRAVDEYGVRNWVAIEKFSGLARPAKNCRLRWLNYLRPNLKKYPFTLEEENLILDLHSKYGNSWSRIASKVSMHFMGSCDGLFFVRRCLEG
ncbi:UNVERIFIED_CONTAM: Transcription factor GAMYB [Sesamum indicum]